MPRTATKSLAFPLAGVSRRGPYRQQTRPFSAPWALNVRTVGPSETRRRGGSRPGLAKLCPTDLGGSVTALIPVSYIDSGGTRRYDLVYVVDGTLGYIRAGVATTTTAELEGPDGVDIVTDDGSTTIDFAATVSTGALQGVVRGGRVYFADTTLQVFSPATGVVEPVLATTSVAVPTGQPLIALYRDRIFLAGSDQAWYASRVSDPGDWDYGADAANPTAAIAGQLSDAGVVGDVLTAMIPIHDQVLVMATASELWVLRGDPATGRLENVSDSVGIVDTNAWAMSPDGTLVFLSHDGVYVWSAGTRAAPTRFSAERVPDELREIDTSTTTVSMAYDPEGRGYHLFLTPADPGVGTHWWIDLDNRAFWPQRYDRFHQPLAAAHLAEAGLGNVVIASQDGYVRYFLDGQEDDDGEDLESHLLIGPVRIAANDVRDALLAEINGVVEDLGGPVTWRVVMGPSAAEAAEDALADLNLVLDGQDPTSAAASGTWTEGRNRVSRPRTRGAWAVIWLSSTTAWSYEVVAVVARQLGRHR